MLLEFIIDSGAIECDYVEGPNYEEDCYSQWRHPEVKFQIEDITEIEGIFLNFITEELSYCEEDSDILFDYEAITIHSLVNDLNQIPTEEEVLRWKKGEKEVIWLKDSYIEILVDGKTINIEESDFSQYFPSI
jgi:hypothetical protein